MSSLQLTPLEIRERILRKLNQSDGASRDVPEMPKEFADLSNLRSRLLLLREDCRKIGQPPPRPPTLRAGIGAFLVSVVRRMLFWYTPPLQYVLDGFTQVLEGTLQSIEQTAESLDQRIRETAESFDQRMLEMNNRLNDQREELEQERRRSGELEKTLQQEQKFLRAIEQNLLRDLHGQQEQLNAVEGRLPEWREHLLGLEERLASFREESASAQRKEGLARQSLRREILGQARRVSRLLEETRKGTPDPQVFDEEFSHDLDPLYLAFEDELRGTREEIETRLRIYLPYLQGASSVLDVGCGRGEWLDLLRREGIAARGVDWNRFMVEECRRHGLQVEEADALAYLSRVPNASLGAVTVFHMVEHVPFRKLIQLLDDVTRVLEPGGVAIFETPNPNNLLVGSRNFYYDPTHRNPIPSETLRFLVESRGLCQVEVLPLNPCDPCNLVPNENGSLVVERFNEYFYGPQDYAVIGRKV